MAKEFLFRNGKRCLNHEEMKGVKCVCIFVCVFYPKCLRNIFPLLNEEVRVCVLY